MLSELEFSILLSFCKIVLLFGLFVFATVSSLVLSVIIGNLFGVLLSYVTQCCRKCNMICLKLEFLTEHCVQQIKSSTWTDACLNRSWKTKNAFPHFSQKYLGLVDWLSAIVLSFSATTSSSQCLRMWSVRLIMVFPTLQLQEAHRKVWSLLPGLMIWLYNNSRFWNEAPHLLQYKDWRSLTDGFEESSFVLLKIINIRFKGIYFKQKIPN